MIDVSKLDEAPRFTIDMWRGGVVVASRKTFEYERELELWLERNQCTRCTLLVISDLHEQRRSAFLSPKHALEALRVPRTLADVALGELVWAELPLIGRAKLSVRERSYGTSRCRVSVLTTTSDDISVTDAWVSESAEVVE